MRRIGKRRTEKAEAGPTPAVLIPGQQPSVTQSSCGQKTALACWRAFPFPACIHLRFLGRSPACGGKHAGVSISGVNDGSVLIALLSGTGRRRFQTGTVLHAAAGREGLP